MEKVMDFFDWAAASTQLGYKVLHLLHLQLDILHQDTILLSTP
jgi:hypothetical protein